MKTVVQSSLIVLCLILCISTAAAQTVALVNDPETDYPLLKIEAESAGIVSIRGDWIIGIDWVAQGKEAVTVPWINYNPIPGEQNITVNGKPIQIITHEVNTRSKIRPGVINPDMYIPILGWQPAQPLKIRRNIVVAAIASVLILLAIRLIINNRAFLLSAMICVSLLILGFVLSSQLFHQIELKRTLRIKDQNHYEWNYLAYTRPGRYETIYQGLYQTLLFPQSEAHLRRLDPVLKFDSRAHDIKLEYFCSANDPVAIYQKLPGKSWTVDNREKSEKIISPRFIKKIYERDYIVEDDVMILKPN